MIDLLASLLPHILVGLFALSILLFLVSLQQLRRGRTGPYWRLRRTAGQRGGQLFLASITLFIAASALALFSGLADLAYARLREAINYNPDAPKGVVLPSITPTLRFTLTPTDVPSATPTDTNTPVPDTNTPVPTDTLTPSQTPSPTQTATITFTPSPTFEMLLVLTAPASTVTPRANASVNMMAASRQVAADGSPVEPATTFPAGTGRIYLFFDYRNMDNGITWTRILYRDGIQIQGGSYIWSLGETGENYFFFGIEGGYPPGDYEVRLYLGEREVDQYKFSVVNP